MIYQDQYLPVDPDFTETVNEVVLNLSSGKIHFFNHQDEVDDVSGVATSIEKNIQGEFLKLSETSMIRLDKIITIYGRPGPAYDRYDAFANACLACEDLGQF